MNKLWWDEVILIWKIFIFEYYQSREDYFNNLRFFVRIQFFCTGYISFIKILERVFYIFGDLVINWKSNRSIQRKTGCSTPSRTCLSVWTRSRFSLFFQFFQQFLFSFVFWKRDGFGDVQRCDWRQHFQNVLFLIVLNDFEVCL